MTYDKKTRTITVTSDDPKDGMRDIFKFFEDVTQDMAQDPNASPEVVEMYRKLRNTPGSGLAMTHFDPRKS